MNRKESEMCDRSERLDAVERKLEDIETQVFAARSESISPCAAKED